MYCACDVKMHNTVWKRRCDYMKFIGNLLAVVHQWQLDLDDLRVTIYSRKTGNNFYHVENRTSKNVPGFNCHPDCWTMDKLVLSVSSNKSPNWIAGSVFDFKNKDALLSERKVTISFIPSYYSDMSVTMITLFSTDNTWLPESFPFIYSFFLKMFIVFNVY